MKPIEGLVLDKKNIKFNNSQVRKTKKSSPLHHRHELCPTARLTTLSPALRDFSH